MRRKLTKEQVRLVREGRACGIKCSIFAMAYGCTEQAISQIANGKRYTGLSVYANLDELTPAQKRQHQLAKQRECMRKARA